MIEDSRGTPDEAMSSATQKTTTSIVVQVENQEIAGGIPIIIIFNGLVGGGDSNTTQIAHAR